LGGNPVTGFLSAVIKSGSRKTIGKQEEAKKVGLNRQRKASKKGFLDSELCITNIKE